MRVLSEPVRPSWWDWIVTQPFGRAKYLVVSDRPEENGMRSLSLILARCKTLAGARRRLSQERAGDKNRGLFISIYDMDSKLLLAE
jgi:hypothetical protein